MDDVHGESSSLGDGSQRPSGSADAEAARRPWDTDLGCPGCGYNLRGLPYVAGDGDASGLLVDCPECGLRSDLGELARRRWDKPWYKAPGFNVLTGPVAWLLLGGMTGLLALGAIRAGSGPDTAWLVMLAAASVLAGGWVALLVLVWRRYGGPAGVLFSLLAHLVLGAYLAGLALAVAGIVSVYLGLWGSPRGADVSTVTLGVACIVGSVALFVGGRVCERQVAGHCIRLYLRRGTTS